VKATEALLAQLKIAPDTRVLDIGSGLGGPARHIAEHSGAHVTGVDLTPLYVELAQTLSARVGMSAQTEFFQGSALDLPVADASFDLATMFHVGMNIQDKAALMRQVARVLAPGGRFALFDVMRVGAGALRFPFPWADREALSFVAPPEDYRAAAAAAGLVQLAERDRSHFALDFFAGVFASIAAKGGPPPVGIHLLMRESAGPKLQNFVAEIEAGRLAPVEMIFRKD
jgi:ubiquinone/menaquinone biosynthesis C-methylase UbiE